MKPCITLAALIGAFGLGLLVGRQKTGATPVFTLDTQQPIFVIGPDTALRLEPTGYWNWSGNGGGFGHSAPWQLQLSHPDGSRSTLFCKSQPVDPRDLPCSIELDTR